VLLNLLQSIPFVRGDINSDGDHNISDATSLLYYLFQKRKTPSCLKAADANDDGSVNIADAIYLLTTLFLESGEFPAPFPECGFDPTPDGLGCGQYAPCEVSP
jgi:hypothetical protein